MSCPESALISVRKLNATEELRNVPINYIYGCITHIGHCNQIATVTHQDGAGQRVMWAMSWWVGNIGSFTSPRLLCFYESAVISFDASVSLKRV